MGTRTPPAEGGRTTPRGPLSLGRYVRRQGAWSALVWLWFLGWSGHYGYAWCQREGRVSAWIVAALGAWTAFFGVFLGWCSASLQARRKLLLGRLEPTPEEWARLEAEPRRPLRHSFWATALVAGWGAALVVGLGTLALAGFRPEGALGRLEVMACAFAAPWLLAAAVTPWALRRSVARFVAAVEHDQPLRLPRWRYLLLHNVLPYALFSAAAGLAVSFFRFLPEYQAGRALSAHTLSLHLATTVLVISLLVVGAARLKTRVDFLSPLEITGRARRDLRARWRVWYALAAGPLTYGALRAVLGLLGLAELGVRDAILLKVATCLALCALIAYWAVSSTLAAMEQEGLDEHRYVRLHRLLRRFGLLGERARRG